MKRTTERRKKGTMGLLAGASLLMSGCGAAMAGTPVLPAEALDSETDAVRADNFHDTNTAQAERVLGETRLRTDDFVWKERTPIVKVAHIKGEFSFDQDVLTPDDEIFNLYGTVMTGVCATPGFAMEEEAGNYYVNVGGRIEKAYRVNVAELGEEKSESRILKCSCGMTAGGLSNARVTGVPLGAVLEMAQLEETINCVTVYGADGYGVPMPLTYALEKEALLVYQINGKPLPSQEGGAVQLWMPEAVARYFTRNITHIELTAEAKEPPVLQAGEGCRAKINILNYADGVEFKAGETIRLEGYADDYDVAIEAVEFSLDGGETWTVCPTDGAQTDRWVYWQFAFTLEEPGEYEMTVRARTAQGMESPLASTLCFRVADSAR